MITTVECKCKPRIEHLRLVHVDPRAVEFHLKQLLFEFERHFSFSSNQLPTPVIFWPWCRRFSIGYLCIIPLELVLPPLVRRRGCVEEVGERYVSVRPDQTEHDLSVLRRTSLFLSQSLLAQYFLPIVLISYPLHNQWGLVPAKTEKFRILSSMHLTGAIPDSNLCLQLFFNAHSTWYLHSLLLLCHFG